MPDRVKLRVVVIIQARMGSTRLPGKVLLEVLDYPLLAYLLYRLRSASTPDEVVVATTINSLDIEIVEFCREYKVPLFRGSENDVLDRYYQAAKAFGADVVVRISSDCPLMDPDMVDQVVGFYLDHFPDYDYVSNTLERSYPRGMDVEVFSFAALERATKEATLSSEREHVTPYIYRHPELFRLGSFFGAQDDSNYRLTVDTQEDFDLTKRIIEFFCPNNPDFTLEDILNLLREHPDWLALNAHIRQKEIEDQS